MKNIIISISILFVCTLLGLTSCSHTEEDPLEMAVANYEKQQYIAYTHMMYWPNPLGEIDTFSMNIQFQKHPNPYYDYNYIGERDKHGFVYLDGIFKEINHTDSIVLIYSDQELKDKTYMVKENMFTSSQPLTILTNDTWAFKQDTTISGKRLSNYFVVGMDTIVDGKEIYMEKHIFIDPANALLDKMERRLYHDKKKAQFILYEYSNYEMDQGIREMYYDQPNHYISKSADDQEKMELLKVGIKAPEFVAMDIKGNEVKLSEYKGKKVLLNFSIINCGWCKIALEDINKDKIKLPEDIIRLYINPRDTKEDISKYAKLYDIPFTVLVEAQSIGNIYGVNGYPTFYLINEVGKIEKVIQGYNRDLLNNI